MIPEKWVPVFRKDHAQRLPDRDATASRGNPARFFVKEIAACIHLIAGGQ
jgi:hypothetical protein